MEHLENLYNIWCPERQKFWKPNSFGYTEVQAEAGVYSEEEAKRICHEPHVAEQMIPIV